MSSSISLPVRVRTLCVCECGCEYEWVMDLRLEGRAVQGGGIGVGGVLNEHGYNFV